jgi:TrmH family RNA methyltransferase
VPPTPLRDRPPSRRRPERPIGDARLPPLSFRHQRVQRLRRLSGRRSARSADRAFVVEGAKLLGEALRAGATVEAVYLDPTGAGPAELGLVDRCLAAGLRVFDLEPGVLGRVTGTVTPQPVIGVVAAADVSLEQVGARSPDLVVICSDVRDPGNAGTVLRSAEAAGADAVICCEGSVDVYNPKTVRASAGTVFWVPVVNGGSLPEVLEAVGAWGLRRLGTVAHDGADYLDADLRAPTALVLGNEAHGLDPVTRRYLDGTVTIPMAGRAESLNVGMAAAVLCFEAARQRRSAPADALRAPGGEVPGLPGGGR